LKKKKFIWKRQKITQIVCYTRDLINEPGGKVEGLRRGAGLEFTEVAISLYATGVSIPFKAFYG
jgi:hypothetical protein